MNFLKHFTKPWTMLILLSIFHSLCSQSFALEVAKDQTAVEVVAALKGSGVIVLLDGSPVIITNSHILQGQKSAKALGENLSVLYDYPMNDFAILQIPPQRQGPYLARAQRNGSFCRQLKSCSKGWRPGSGIQNIENYIVAFIDGTSSTFPIVPTFKSFEKNSDIRIPVYTRPGVSGGAYYERGKLTGLVTKVSLSGEAFTYAQTFQAIGRILGQRQRSTDEGHWVRGKLVINHGADRVVLNSADNGGESGHGGSGSGDDYWTLEVFNFYDTKLVTTWNAFEDRKQSFNLNGNDILMFKEKNRYKYPDLGTYLSPNRRPIEDTPLARKKLHRLRRKHKISMKNLRLYHFDKDSKIFQVQATLDPFRRAFGGQRLYPEARELNQASHPFEWSLDSEGYYSSAMVSSRKSANTIIDLKLLDETNPEPLHILAPQSLEELQIAGLPLARLPGHSSASLRFADATQKYKALYIYDSADLTKLERIFIQTPQYLIELWDGQDETL
jgi:hypothetical protein